jgi:hypothetical protein
MFRIIQFKIPVAQFDKLIEDRPDATRRFYDEAGDLARIDGFYVSLPMSTTSKQFFVAEQYLRSLVGDPPHLIENVTATFSLLRTRAPKSYDYGYVIDIGTMPGEFGEERLVAIPKRSVEYQSGRYSSGMYTPIACG